jgi:flagellin
MNGVLIEGQDTMSLTLGANILSLKIANAMRKTSDELSVTIERAAFGSRINGASGDSGARALADSLRNQSRVLGAASRNANDAISFTSVADSGLQEITNLLGRMSELAAQGTNSTMTSTTRSAAQVEWLALGSEIDRVVQTSSFNSIGVLSGQAPTIQVGYDNSASSRISLIGIAAGLANLSLATGSTLTYSLTGGDTNAAVTASRNAYTAISNAVNSVTLLRGSVAGNQGRLQSAVNSITVVREQLLTAESNQRDSDVAQDAADLLRLQIIQQTQASLLAQANQSASLVLSLLG